MWNPPTSVHLLFLVKDLAEVNPSPVGPAIVNVVYPSPPTPIPAYDGPFLTNYCSLNKVLPF